MVTGVCRCDRAASFHRKPIPQNPDGPGKHHATLGSAMSQSHRADFITRVEGPAPLRLPALSLVLNKQNHHQRATCHEEEIMALVGKKDQFALTLHMHKGGR